MHNTTGVAIFPKLCLWPRSLCSNLGGIGPEKWYRATLNNIPSLNRVSQVPNSRFCKNFTSCLLNARSVCNKTLVIKDFVVDHAVDLLGITETWLHLKGDDVTIGELCLSVYRFVHTPDRRGLVGV